MKDAIVFKSISGAGIDSVEDQCCGREGYKTFGKSAMFGFGPFLDPVALLLDLFGELNTKVEVKEISRLLHEDIFTVVLVK
jgi:hypothetical protein